MSQHASGRSRRCAFTLIELIAVLVIVSVAAAIATAAMGGSTKVRRGMAGRQLARDLTFLRGRAMATGVRSWIYLDAANSSYLVGAENIHAPGYSGAAQITDPSTGKAYGVLLNTKEFAGVRITGVSIQGGVPALGFDWLGRPLYAGSSPALLTTDATITLSGNTVVRVRAGGGNVEFTPGS